MKNVSEIIGIRGAPTGHVDCVHPNFWIVYDSGLVEMFGYRLITQCIQQVRKNIYHETNNRHNRKQNI